MTDPAPASYTDRADLKVDAALAAFVEAEALPGTGIAADAVWAGLSALIKAFGPKRAELLQQREDLQERIDAWHMKQAGGTHDPVAYRAFLEEIGYLVPEPDSVQIAPGRIDPEISSLAAPQLVVPATNARFALNAANARWGSLYDALYGTDALGSPPPTGAHDPERGKQVVAWAKANLDRAVPLTKGSWANIVSMAPAGGKLILVAGKNTVALRDPTQFAGFNRGADGALTDLFFRVNGLHIVLVLDRSDPIGRDDPAGIADMFIEAAASTIVDMEDSVACVDGADKVLAYRNWLGLMKGDLTAEVSKGGTQFTRELNPDIGFTDPTGQPVLLKGRALLLVRNVGHLMTTPAVLDASGAEAPEGFLDALITVLIALHDLRRSDGPRNSPAGAIYVVKPKMHGPDEVRLADQTFAAVEQVLGLPAHTVKIGIMDEERRTSANLAACIDAARERVAFINTGFLDRTGDEIHTSMEAGPMVPKGQMKSATWLTAYETRNVDIGMQCGLKGRAQIGKGMWAMPDRMADMLDQKIAHPHSGATCAWVPSPTAAVLHATHYHQVDVFQQLYTIAEAAGGAPRAMLDDLLTIPLQEGTLPEAEITAEVENSAQSILGYVVRWIDQGVGCSKVPDIHDIGLMEDRATLRISAQGLANWLKWDVVSPEQVMAALRKMAVVVDQQNAGDPIYRPMAPDFDGIAFQAACDLVFKGRVQPAGYTEPILHQRRAEAKARE
mgnify:FL=1